ncbi:ATP synthase protein I [Breoghania corrubedonensis]|uniref:ATP synthase protein I n=1 Tax=Breoghania corrubedonensis TaxID=665038 RepID=A0A2T5VEQ0_9HYPH|nr:AtpZ/AtpI family protein [Breoghania corrubedonensis]PTW62231.1 ATP synthase protein I [Breoghania corrubedonensis]
MADDKRPANGAQPDEGGDKAILPEDDNGLTERLDRLNRSLSERSDRDEAEKKRASRTGNAAGYAQAVKLSSEFIAGVAVGAVIGWVFDQWLGTKPWGLIVFLLLGFVAGVLNVLRSAGVVADPAEKQGRDDR